MSDIFFIFVPIFFLTWLLSFLPQIRLYFPNRIPGAPSWAQGGSFLCFCTLKCSKQLHKDSDYWQMVSRHEYCHQIQQRFLSPLVLGILYLLELVIRRIFINSDWHSSYQNVFWEKQAVKYMNRKTI